MEPVPLRFDARDYLRVFLKRKWFITVIAVAAMLLGGVYGALAPKEFRATSLVLVRQPPKGIFWMTGATPPAEETVEVGLDTQAAIATSIANADATAKSLSAREGPDRVVAEPTDIVASLRATVLPPDRIRIEATHVNKQRAIAYAWETANTFCETAGSIRTGDERRAREFLQKEIRERGRDLADLTRSANAFRGAAGIYSPTTGVEKLQDVLNSYRGQLATAEADAAAAAREAASLRGQLAHVEPFRNTMMPTVNPLVDGLKHELTADQIALTQLRARYTEDHPAVADMKARIAQIGDEIKAQPQYVQTPAVVQNGNLDQMRLHLSDAEARALSGAGRAAVLRETVARAQVQIAQVADKQFRLTQFADEMEMGKTTLKNMQQDLQAKELSLAMDKGTAIIIDHPEDATATSAPVGRSVLFGGVLGLFCGLVLALALEMLDDTIRTPEDLTRETQIPFLGMVPLLEGGTPELITVAAPKSPPAEAYRTLRSNINFSLIDEPARTFLVTSAGAGEGKSVTAANLAVAYAQSGQTVLLVDTDLRRATQHRYFSRESTRGLTNILMGDTPPEDVIQATDVDNLSLLASGPLPPNPSELLDSRRMTAAMEQLSGLADIIIYDSPPAVVVSDSAILASKVDRTILIAEAGQVTRTAFAEMVKMIQHARGRIIGGILNKLRLTSSDYYYYYYYYYDYTPDRQATREVETKA